MTEADGQLKRWFSLTAGGSWGDPPGEGEHDAICVRGTDLDFDRLSVDLTRAPVRGFSHADLSNRSLKVGDIVIEKSGGGENQPVGRVGLYCSEQRAVPTNFAAMLRPGPATHPKFACYVLASLYFLGEVRSVIKQTTGIQNLDLDALLAKRVPRQSLAEQRAIADYLDIETARIDALITKKRELSHLLEERWKAELRKRTRLGMGTSVSVRDSGLGWVGQIPSHWRIAPNRSFLRLRRRLVGDSAALPTLLSLTRKGVIVRDVSDNHGKFPASFETYQHVLPGDLVFCLFDVPETPRTVGLAWDEGMITGAYDVFECRGVARYFDYLFRGFDDEKSLSLFYTGMRNVIRKDVFLGMRSPVPPLPEQSEIANELDRRSNETRSLVALTTRQIELLAERRQALITAAVTGEFAVPGAA